MSEIRSIELVMIDGGLTAFTKINGVPQSEFSTGYTRAAELRHSDLLDTLSDHLGMHRTVPVPDDWVDY